MWQKIVGEYGLDIVFGCKKLTSSNLLQMRVKALKMDSVLPVT